MELSDSSSSPVDGPPLATPAPFNSLHQTISLHPESQRWPLRQPRHAQVYIRRVCERECEHVRDAQHRRDAQIVAQAGVGSLAKARGGIGLHDLANVAD